VYETRVPDTDELLQRLLYVWHGLKQLLIDDAVAQGPTRLHACVLVPMADILNIPYDYQLVFSVGLLDAFYASYHNDILRVRYKYDM